jgi:hypothetical protein
MQSQSHPQARSTFGGGFAIYFVVLVLVAVAAFAAGRYVWQDDSGGSNLTTNQAAIAPSVTGPALTSAEVATATQAYTEMVWDEYFGPVPIAPSGPLPSLTAAEAFAFEAAYTEMVWDYLFGTIPPLNAAVGGSTSWHDPLVYQEPTEAELRNAISHDPLIYQEPTEAEIARAIAQHENAITAVLGE